ncbi:MAG: thioredoxin family protein [Clostridiales bacterium]|nr:thioredoxin family protein [Clostridiales bacterium]MCF8021129.1 thioredoxin family protein [Clostridiales bacterium]
MNSEIKVYTTPSCPHCTSVKEFLTNNNLDFEEFDVSRDESAKNEMIQKSDKMAVPTVIVGDEVIVGFDKNKLENVLNLS